VSRSCDERPAGPLERPGGEVVIALAGNPNVGKSTLFNALTGLGVSTAHYPGTTREISVATARAGERLIGVIDLPGSYGIGGTAEEERVARRALLELAPDVVVVLLDPTNLARTLFLALEVMDLGFRVVVAVNLADEARRAGVRVDCARLSDVAGVPAVETVATQGVGVSSLVEVAITAAAAPTPEPRTYGPDFEALVEPLVRRWESEACVPLGLTPRAAALGVLEERHEIVEAAPESVRRDGVRIRRAVASHFGESVRVHVARERHGLAGLIGEQVVVRTPRRRGLLPHDLWALTTWPWTGVPLVVLVAASIFGFLFFVGEFLAGSLSALWERWAAPLISAGVGSVAGDGVLARVLLWGFDAGIEASLAIGLPYILTFYFLLGLLEDTGYLNSLAFLTDRVMHRFGLHGRAVVPLVAAAGCSVPALVAAGDLPTRRERLIASTLVVFVPCSARTAVIMGSVGHFLGWRPTLLVLGVVVIVWLAMAFALQRLIPGDSRGLVMEMFPFRRPSVRGVAGKAWTQFREFLFVATPIVIVGSLVLGGLYETGWLMALSGPLEPVVEGLLGLPAIAGLTLIVGMLRKELSLQLLVALAVATTGFAGASLAGLLSETDIVVYALVNTIALPCISSVAVYWRRHGWMPTLAVLGASVAIALTVGAIAARVVPLLGLQ